MDVLEFEKDEKKTCIHSIKIKNSTEKAILKICKQTNRKFNGVVNDILEYGLKAVKINDSKAELAKSAGFGEKFLRIFSKRNVGKK